MTEQLSDQTSDNDWLRMRVAELGNLDQPAAPESVALRDLGLQSVDFVVLLADIEDRLGVLLEDEDLDDENFADVRALEKLLARVRGRHA